MKLRWEIRIFNNIFEQIVGGTLNNVQCIKVDGKRALSFQIFIYVKRSIPVKNKIQV